MLNTINQGSYSTFLSKELKLCEENGAYWYEFTEDCKIELMKNYKEYEDKIGPYKYSFTAPRLKPKVDSGPKFHDDLELNNQPIQNITL